MQSIAKLADEIPWIMAPATLTATMVAISIVIVGIQLLKSESQKLVASVLFIIFIWAIIMRIILH